MKNIQENIFVITNPLFYIWAFLYLIVALINRMFQYIGLYDWYFVLFIFRDIDNDRKLLIHETHINRKIKLFYTKQKAWDYALRKYALNPKH